MYSPSESILCSWRRMIWQLRVGLETHRKRNQRPRLP